MNAPTTSDAQMIRLRFEAICERVAAAASLAGRNANDVKLVVVTKGQSPKKMQAVIQAGAQYLGENYPEETQLKIAEIPESLLNAVELHLIGHLQSRKIPLMFNRFALFQALDSLKLAEKLNRKIIEIGARPQRAFLQYNVSGEDEKFGWLAADPARWPELCNDYEKLISMKGLHISGMMTMPPLTGDAEQNRVFFERLRKLMVFLNERYPEQQLTDLSMGTSQDFEAAILEGSTFIRIGSAIMGERVNLRERME